MFGVKALCQREITCKECKQTTGLHKKDNYVAKNQPIRSNEQKINTEMLKIIPIITIDEQKGGGV